MYPEYLNVESGTVRETKTLGVKGDWQHQRHSQASFHSLILGLVPRPHSQASFPGLTPRPHGWRESGLVSTACVAQPLNFRKIVRFMESVNVDRIQTKYWSGCWALLQDLSLRRRETQKILLLSSGEWGCSGIAPRLALSSVWVSSCACWQWSWFTQHSYLGEAETFECKLKVLQETHSREH